MTDRPEPDPYDELSNALDAVQVQGAGSPSVATDEDWTTAVDWLNGAVRDRAEGETHHPIDAPIQAVESMRRCLHALREQLSQVEKERDEAVRTITSIAVMLGWMNVPPRQTLEADVRALKSRVKDSAELSEKLEGLRERWTEQEQRLARQADGQHGTRWAEILGTRAQTIGDCAQQLSALLVEDPLRTPTSANQEPTRPDVSRDAT